MPDVKNAAIYREEARHKEDFVTKIKAEIVAKDISKVRIHVSGDFDSEVYIDKWIQIVQARPNTKFYFYTRSWRLPNLLPKIDELADCGNITAWFSCDKDTGEPPLRENIGRAYMAVSDDEVIQYPTEMVFRVSRKTRVVKWNNGSTVCPVERVVNRTVDHSKITCANCKLCNESNKLVWLRGYTKGKTTNV